MKKFRLIGDYHTHTLYSRNGHGKGTIRENAERALSLGLKELYITDHGPGHLFFGLKRKMIPIVRKEIVDLNKEFEGRIKIFFGVEANVVDYDGKIDIKEDEIKYFDIINVGYHTGVRFLNIKSEILFRYINPLSKYSSRLENYIREKNTEALIKIVENYPIRIITHPGEKVNLDIRKLAEACEKQGTLLEINGHHNHISVENLAITAQTDCRFSVGSDAHFPDAVGSVEGAFRRIEESGIPLTKVENVELLEGA